MSNQPKRTMDGYGADELSIPQLKLIQNVGGDYAKDNLNAQPGDFFFPLTNEIIPAGEQIDIIIVDMPKTRTFWGREELDEDPPLCSSLDGEFGMDGTECKNCPHLHNAPWMLAKTERRTMCLMAFNVLAFQVKDGLPLMIRCHGISTKSARDLMTLLKLNKELKGELNRAIVHVTSAKKKTASGEAFMFKFQVDEHLIQDEALAQEYLAETIQLLGAVKEMAALPAGDPEDDMLIAPPSEDPAAGLYPETEFTDGQTGRVTGSLIEDPLLRFTPTGKAICTLKLRTDTMECLNVTAWEKLAEELAAQDYLHQGDMVEVTGKVKISHWENVEGPQTSLELVAKHVIKLEGPVAKKPAPPEIEEQKAGAQKPSKMSEEERKAKAQQVMDELRVGKEKLEAEVPNKAQEIDF